MDQLCPTCGQPVRADARRRRRRQILQEIRQIERQIMALENGALYDTLARLTGAPSCTICGQAPPGKPGQPNPTIELVRALLVRRARLERELHHLEQEG